MPAATVAAVSRQNGKPASPPPKNRAPVTPSWVGRVPQLKPGQYADGMPIHSPEYICCKLILRPNKFHSRESFFDFGKVMREPAKEHGVKYCLSTRMTSACTTTPSFCAAGSRTKTVSQSASPRSSSSTGIPSCRPRPRPTSGRISSAIIASSSRSRPCL